MSAPLSIAEAAAPETRGAAKIAPIWRAAHAAASLVARPAMVRDEVSAAHPAGFRMAALAAGTAFAGSAVGLAFFLSRKPPTGAAADSHAKFRA